MADGSQGVIGRDVDRPGNGDARDGKLKTVVGSQELADSAAGHLMHENLKRMAPKGWLGEVRTPAQHPPSAGTEQGR